MIYAILLAWAFVCLFPIYWTVTTAFKEAKDIYQRRPHPLGPVRAELERVGVAWTLARHDRRASSARDAFLKHAANTVTISLSAALLADRHRLAGRLWTGPVLVSVWTVAKQGHLVLVPLTADSASGRDRPAASCPLSGAGSPGHAHWLDPRLHDHEPADRDLDHARPVQLDSR